MTYTEFVKTVESTSWHQPDERLLHAAMGLLTETAELYEIESEQHELEELGDVLWYLALAFDAIGAKMEEALVLADEDFYARVRGSDAGETIVIYAADVLDALKKQIFYGRPYDTDKILDSLTMVYNAVLKSLSVGDFPFTIDQVMEANMKKLKARFPDKFTEEAANNRDVKEEYAAMSR